MDQKTLSTFSKISKTILRGQSLKSATNTIISEIVSFFKASECALFLLNHKEKLIVAHDFASSSQAGSYVIENIKNRFSELATSYSPTQNLIGECVSQKKTFIDNNLVNFIYPTVSKKLAQSIQTIGGIKTLIALPAIMEGEVVGVVLLAFKEDEKHVRSLLPLMELFIDQVAIAINNALKYQELKDKHDELENLLNIEKEVSALISHELKTPIAIANNSAQLMQYLIEDENSNLNEERTEIKELHDHLTRGVKRIDDISNSIFNLREIERQVPQAGQSMDLTYSLEQILAEFKRKAEKKGLKFTKSIRNNAKDAIGPGIQFEQALTILIDNAVKYTEKGGIDVKIRINKTKISASVSDTGPGIPKGKHEEIFKRFNRIQSKRNDVEGLGLGLYIAKTIADKLGGNITVSTNKNAWRGSCFNLEIPLKKVN